VWVALVTSHSGEFVNSNLAGDASATRRILGLPWPAQVTVAEKNTLIAGGLGWMLDSLDVTLYALVIAHLMSDFGMTKAVAGGLSSLTLIASAIGGVTFGVIADRVGRTRALMGSILVYSLASGASGLSRSIFELASFRFILGLGMGGEWTTGAALVAETWRAEHRGKALGLVQSSWAIGEILAVAVTAMILPRYGWRAVFFAGVTPGIAVFWILRYVPESPLWRQRAARRSGSGSLRLLWRKGIRRNGLIATAMNALTLFGYWGLFTWIPAYLSLPSAQGGRGLGQMQTAGWLITMSIGRFFGYVLFGFLGDWLGRRKSYVGFLLMAAILVPIYGFTRNTAWLLILGPFVAFFGSGYFSGYAAIASELFPTEIRATAMGISYNVGRVLSALAPFAIGMLAARFGLGPAFLLQSLAFLLAGLLALTLPETKGKELA
jgi:MFS family permease